MRLAKFCCVLFLSASAIWPAHAQNLLSAGANAAQRPADGLILLGTGSGVAVNNSTILSNRHVLNHCSAVRVHNKFFSLNSSDISFSTDDSLDLGIVRFAPGSFSTLVSIDAGKPDLGEPIYTLGYPLGYTMSDEVKYTSGEITSIGDSVGFIHDAVIDSGSSGSGVFNKDNDYLIGLNTQFYRQNAVFAVAIRALSLKYFLDLNNIAYNAAAAAPSRDNNIAATVFVDCYGTPQQPQTPPAPAYTPPPTPAPQQPQKLFLWRCQITGRQSARTGRFYTLPPERQNTIIYKVDFAAKKVTTSDKTGTTAEYYVANFNFLNPNQNDGTHYRLTMDFSGYALRSLRFAGAPNSPDFNVGEYYDGQVFFGVCSIMTP